MTRFGILGMGAMGAAFAAELRTQGNEVATCLAHRSARSQERAVEAGVTILPSLSELVKQSDIFFSLVPSDQAEPLAGEIAATLDGTSLHYVDCNVLIPERIHRIAGLITDAGAVFSDASIIGPPPGQGLKPHLYVSGPHAEELGFLASERLAVTQLGVDTTQATLLKIMFSATNKGAVALLSEVLRSADTAGIRDVLVTVLEEKIPGLYGRYTFSEPGLADKAARWAIEMKEIEEALRGLGADGAFHAAAARVYERMSNEDH